MILHQPAMIVSIYIVIGASSETIIAARCKSESKISSSSKLRRLLTVYVDVTSNFVYRKNAKNLQNEVKR